MSMNSVPWMPIKCKNYSSGAWTPAGVTLPDEKLIPEVIASLIRMTGGKLVPITRLSRATSTTSLETR